LAAARAVTCAFCSAEDNALAETTVNRTALWEHEMTEYITLQMIRKTRKVVGNVWRVQQFIRKLVRGEPTTTLVIGGSNCLEAYTGSRRNFASLIEDCEFVRACVLSPRIFLTVLF
jgi:hypothetical protein